MTRAPSGELGESVSEAGEGAAIGVWTHAMTERLQVEREPNGVLRCSGATLTHDGQRVCVRAGTVRRSLSRGIGGAAASSQLSGISRCS